MRNQNVVQAREKTPHEKQCGHDSKRARVVLRRRTGCRSCRRSCYFWTRHFANLLPPRLSLYAVCKPISPILEWNSTYKSAESVRPVSVCQKSSKHRPAKELPSSPDLRRYRKLAQPAVVEWSNLAVGVIKTGFKSKREILIEENFRASTE